MKTNSANGLLGDAYGMPFQWWMIGKPTIVVAILQLNYLHFVAANGKN